MKSLGLQPSTPARNRRCWVCNLQSSICNPQTVLAVLLVLASFLPFSRSVGAQDISLGWQALGGPGGRISHLATDGRTLYAVSTGGVHRSDDQTQWWEAGTFYRNDALYHSQDNGATWQPATNNAPPGAITALYADPSAATLYLATRGDEGRSDLWRSSDQGASWEPVPLGRTDLRIVAITRSAGGRALFVGATDSTNEPASYVYRSTDSGRTWAASTLLRAGERPGGVLADLAPHPNDSNRLFALMLGGDLYLSEDAGQTWSLPRALADPATSGVVGPAYLAFDADQPDVAVAVLSHSQPVPLGVSEPISRSGLLQRSTDGGTTWTRLNATGLPAGFSTRALAAAPGGVFLLGTATGAYRSADGGLTWRLLEGSLSSGGVSEFLVLPASASGLASVAGQTVLAATGYGVFASRDAGALWQPLGTGLPFNSKIAGLLTNSRQPERVLAISDNRPLGGTVAPPPVLRSLDRGRTPAGWTPVAGGLPEISPTAWALDPSDPNTLFLTAEGDFFRSTDAGLSWTTTRLPSGGQRVLAVSPSNSSVLYIGGESLLRSTDRGATWQEVPVLLSGQERHAHAVTGLVIDPANAEHLWASLADDGVAESTDGGKTWQPAGLAGQKIGWLAVEPAPPGSATAGPAPTAGAATGDGLRLYAGVAGDGVYRRDGPAERPLQGVEDPRQGETAWVTASGGLPKGSTIIAFLSDPRTPGTVWASRDGGGIYRSTDRGASWANVGAGLGDNLAQALAVDYTIAGGVLIGTATTGIWALKPNAQPSSPPRAVDARVELVWPHEWAPVAQAKQANLGLRLFTADSLLPPPCNWVPKVTVWQSEDVSPAEPLDSATQRSVDGRPFPFWDLNDIDVSRANDPQHTLYFMVRVDAADTRTSIWAHGADPRTFYPQPEVPSGIASGTVSAVDARIQIVWPHDEIGASRPVTEATHANISVAFFTHGTRLSVPMGWQPTRMRLFGAWNGEIGRPLAQQATLLTRKAGAISYPTWEFNNIPVGRATVPGNTLYLWVVADGVETYPTIWAHGADARTFFPAKDEPAQGCIP